MKVAKQQSAMDKFTEEIGDGIHSFFYIVEKGQKPEPRFDGITLGVTCGLTVLLLASACWAASIACSRRRNGFIHFIGGLIIPILYPLIILLALDIPGKWTAGQKEESKPKDESEEATEETEQPQLVKDENGQIPFQPTQLYFTKIARRDDGKPAGPWKVNFAGTQIVVTQIIEALPECVNVEFYDASPEKMRTMRIPFTKIQSWEPMD